MFALGTAKNRLARYDNDTAEYAYCISSPIMVNNVNQKMKWLYKLNESIQTPVKSENNRFIKD